MFSSIGSLPEAHRFSLTARPKSEWERGGRWCWLEKNLIFPGHLKRSRIDYRNRVVLVYRIQQLPLNVFVNVGILPKKMAEANVWVAARKTLNWGQFVVAVSVAIDRSWGAIFRYLWWLLFGGGIQWLSTISIIEPTFRRRPTRHWSRRQFRFAGKFLEFTKQLESATYGSRTTSVSQIILNNFGNS